MFQFYGNCFYVVKSEKKKSEKEAFDSKEVEIEQLNKELKREIEENNEMKSFSIEIHDKINEIDKTIVFL